MRSIRRLLVILGVAALLVLLLVTLSAPVGATPTADVAKGKATYDRVCAVCHGFEGKGGPIAPPLAKDLTFIKSAGVPDAIIAGLLNQATKERPPGAMMPVLNPDKINDADVSDIADYLSSLAPAGTPLPAGDAARGAQPYAANCAGCHGDKGQGVTGPPLAAMAAQFKAAGLPPNVMAGLVNLAVRSGSLPTMPTFPPDKLNDAAVADIAAFIVTLPAPAGPPPSPPPAAPPQGGKALYDAVCAVCHGFEGKGGPIAPPLAKDIGFFKDVGLPAQALGPLLIQATKVRPPGALMPVLNPDKVNDAEVIEIGNYLFELAPTPAAVIPPGNAQAGAAPYAASCASCHGAKGEGGAGPPLVDMVAGLRAAGAPDAVMHALVRLASRSGSLPTMPTFSPDQLSDRQLADIAAFISSLVPSGPTALPRTGELSIPYALLAALACLVFVSGLVLRARARKL